MKKKDGHLLLYTEYLPWLELEKCWIMINGRNDITNNIRQVTRKAKNMFDMHFDGGLII